MREHNPFRIAGGSGGVDLGGRGIVEEPDQDQELARLKLGTMGMNIDDLTQDQIDYMDDYSIGT